MSLRKIFVSYYYFLLASCALVAQGDFSVTLTRDLPLAPDGLFFTGDREVGYRFGRRITPHGDCIDVTGDYAYVTWYRGGMDKRDVRLSRIDFRADNPSWETIEFPHKHIGYQGDSTIGDSHNTIAVEANPVDGSIHMLYDMHAYSQASYPDDFFNYSVSKNGVAQITDGEFDLSLFFPKRNYLKRGEDYDRATYPEIQAAPNGQMIVRYRLGGAGNGDIIFSSYEAGAWGAPYRFSDGTIPLPDRYSLYGSERFIRGRLHAGFSVRYAQNPAYALNSGLHYAYADAPYGPDNWRDIDGNPVSIPFGAPDALRVGNPEDDHGTADAPRTAQGPHFTVTAAGDIHFVTRVDNRNVHYWRAAGQQAFQSAVGGDILRPDGYLFDYGEYVVATGLINDRVVIRAARGGTNDWETLYQQQGGAEYDHFNGIVSDDQLLLYAMREASGDARPLHLLQFQLSGGTTSVNAPTREAPRVFPNPTTGRLSIDVGGTDAPYQLYDLGGRLLKSGNVDGRLLQLDGYAAGVYLLRVRTSSGWAARRIVLH